jgi:acyl carrier protein
MTKRHETTSERVALLSGLAGAPVCGWPSAEPLLMAVQNEFDLVIPESQSNKMRTVGDLHTFVVAELERLGRPAVDTGHILEQMKRVIAEELGTKPSKITPNSRLA